MNRKLLRRGSFSFENAIDELRRVLKEAPGPFEVKVNNKAVADKQGEGHTEIATVLLSDWHVSEVVNPDEINGVNKYNSIIASNRIWELTQKIKKIISLHKKLYPIQKIWLPLLGDFQSGSLHPDLEMSNDLSDPVAAIFCSRLLQLMTYDLLELGVPVQIDCVVGNHGRLTTKMPAKRAAQTNYDWVIYEILKNNLSMTKNVTVNVHLGSVVPIKCYNWNYVLMHGIDVKQEKIASLEDFVRAVFDDRAYREAASMLGTTFDMILLGHLHRLLIKEKVMVGGCLSGQSELGMSWMLKPIPASQLMFGISKSQVRTWNYTLDVSSVKDERAYNTYSQYAKEFLKKNGRR